MHRRPDHARPPGRAASRRRAAGIALLGLTAFGATACGGDDGGTAAGTDPAAGTDTSAATVPAGTAVPQLVGPVGGTTAKVALLRNGDVMWAYLCDDEGEAALLQGNVNGETVSLQDVDTGASLSGTLDGDAFSGTATLADGTDHPVSASLADGDAGVFFRYRATGADFDLGVWIRTDDAVVGTVISNGSGSGPGGTGDTIPDGAEPVPAKFGDRFRCFLESRKLVKVSQASGATSSEAVLQADAQNAACQAAFGQVTS